MLTSDQRVARTLELLAELEHTNAPEKVRTEIHEVNAPLVRVLAYRMAGDRRHLFEELAAAGHAGLSLAISRWNPEKGGWRWLRSFCMKQEMHAAFHVEDFHHLSWHEFRHRPSILAAYEEAEEEGSDGTAAAYEAAGKRVSTRTVDRVLSAVPHLSLSATAAGGQPLVDFAFPDTAPTPQPVLHDRLGPAKEALAQAWGELTAKQRTALIGQLHGVPNRVLCQELGVSPEAVRQQALRGIERLRARSHRFAALEDLVA